MTDEPRAPGTPAPETPEGDARDAHVAALLEVPALDTVTRRRLVRTAVEHGARSEAGPSRSLGRLGAAVGVAAALAVGAVVGAVVVTRPSDDTPTAARVASTEPTTAAAEAAAPAPQSADAEGSGQATSGAPPQQLGDLGIVRGVAGLREALNGRFERGRGTEAAPADGLACLEQDPGLLGLVVATAHAEAQLDGLPVVVLVGPSPAGQNLAIVLDPARDCEIVQRVTL